MGMLERNNDRQEKSKQRGNQEIESESCQDESPFAQWREDRSEGKAKARGHILLTRNTSNEILATPRAASIIVTPPPS